VTLAGPTVPAETAGVPWLRLHNQVAPTLVIVGTAAMLTTGFVELAANRLVSGRPVSLWNCVPTPVAVAIALLAVVLVALSVVRPRRLVRGAAAFAAGVLVIAIPAVAGRAAASLTAGAPALATVSLGSACWVIFACAALALIDALQRVEARPPVQLLTIVLIGAGFLVLAKTGTFDALSLAREYASRRDVFAAAFVRHIELVVAAIVPALLIGVPLGLAALRRKRFEAPVFAALNLLQTVPSIALFGLLIGPLSSLAAGVPALGRLGIGGVGPAPAIIALVLYALLPIARNTLAGIGGVSPAALDAARGMGMTPRQVFWQVEVPLALPVLLAGLRIVTVQAIGLTIVAALIGAGGLGSFVFEGLGQYATDLVLLGALPAIVLALAADFLLRLAAISLRRRFAP
jgi:osmoprotectant transport system permease protein